MSEPFSAAAAVERAMNGLTQTEVAKRMFVTQTCLSYWRSGKRTPNLTDMAQLLAVTGASWADVFGVPEDEAVLVGFRAGVRASREALRGLLDGGPAA